ncbi:MAG: tyrosine-type recombinase/integrase [Anaerolineales bacterium]|nr:tyrosine-type recombinase/integrase [Anaerolineales bacterium]
MHNSLPGNDLAAIGLKSLFEGVSQITVADAVEAFLNTDMAGKSDDTALWYKRMLTPLVEYLGENRLLSDVLEPDLLDWSAYLNRRQQMYGKNSYRPAVDAKLSVYTVHGYIRATRRFFRWLYQCKILEADLGAALKLPRLPKQGKKGISEANLKAILRFSLGNTRDYALFRFIESTGVRRGGAEHLLLSDLNMDADDPRIRRRATVREKGEKERTVCMSINALEALEDWLKERPNIDDEHVFLGHSPGQPWHALSDEGISSIVDRYKTRLGLKGKCSPHQWRHRWARHNLQRGMELSQVSQLLGHEDVSITVRYYGQFTIDQLQDAYDRHVDELDLDE